MRTGPNKLLRRGARVVAAVASIIVMLLTYESMLRELAPDLQVFMNRAEMRALLAYGVGFSSTGDLTSALIALLAVYVCTKDFTVESLAVWISAYQAPDGA